MKAVLNGKQVTPKLWCDRSISQAKVLAELQIRENFTQILVGSCSNSCVLSRDIHQVGRPGKYFAVLINKSRASNGIRLIAMRGRMGSAEVGK